MLNYTHRSVGRPLLGPALVPKPRRSVDFEPVGQSMRSREIRMPLALDLGRLQDPALRPAGEKVLRGDRLDAADALTLYASPDLLGLGLLADHANRRVNGDRVFFSAN